MTQLSYGQEIGLEEFKKVIIIPPSPNQAALCGGKDFSTASVARESMKNFVIYEGKYITIAYNPFPYLPHPHFVIWMVGKDSSEQPIMSYDQLSEEARAELWDFVYKLWEENPRLVISGNCCTEPGPNKAQSIQIGHWHTFDPLAMSGEECKKQGNTMHVIDDKSEQDRAIIEHYCGLNAMNALMMNFFRDEISRGLIKFPSYKKIPFLPYHDDIILEIKLLENQRGGEVRNIFEQVYNAAYSHMQKASNGGKYWSETMEGYMYDNFYEQHFHRALMSSTLVAEELISPENFRNNFVLGFSFSFCNNAQGEKVLRLKFTVNDGGIDPFTGNKGSQKGGSSCLVGACTRRSPDNPVQTDEQHQEAMGKIHQFGDRICTVMNFENRG